MKKYWCQQNSRGVSHDSYIFWIFFGEGINVPSFIIVGYVRQILGRVAFLPPHPWAAPKSPSWIGLIIPIEVVIKFFLWRLWLFLIIFSQRWSSEMWCLIILFVILLKTIICIHKTIAYLRLLLNTEWNNSYDTLLTVKVERYQNLAIMIINFGF